MPPTAKCWPGPRISILNLPPGRTSRSARGTSSGPGAILEEVCERVEAVGPEAAVARDPVVGGAQAGAAQAAARHAAVPAAVDEAGGLEDAQVLGDRGQRHGERRRQLADAVLALG